MSTNQWEPLLCPIASITFDGETHRVLEALTDGQGTARFTLHDGRVMQFTGLCPVAWAPDDERELGAHEIVPVSFRYYGYLTEG